MIQKFTWRLILYNKHLMSWTNVLMLSTNKFHMVLLFLLHKCHKLNRLWNPIRIVFEEISLKLRSSQSSTSWRNTASTGLTPGRLDCQWWGNREANSCTQLSIHWSGEHGQSRKKINSYNSSCVSTTLRSLQHSGSTWQPATQSETKLCSQKQSAINEVWLIATPVFHCL